MMEVTDPLRELPCVGDGGRQEDVVDVIGEQDDGLLPHNPSLWGKKLIIQNITTITIPHSGDKNYKYTVQNIINITTPRSGEENN